VCVPTCSAFSQLLFILDWLSGSGKASSWPASSGMGPFEVKKSLKSEHLRPWGRQVVFLPWGGNGAPPA
jgi:hypothetical protein